MAGVTIAAVHLAKAQRMRGGLGKLDALFLMTLKTHIGLGDLVEHGIMGRMDGVTIGTGNIAGFVRTALPVDVLVVLVALQAHAILDAHGFI